MPDWQRSSSGSRQRHLGRVALPLIADAIEATGRAEVQFLARDDTQLGRYRLIGAEDAYRAAIRLARSLGDEQ